jgi:hypothetical protein
MKKADNFDASKWLVENKITTQSRLNEDEEKRGFYVTMKPKDGSYGKSTLTNLPNHSNQTYSGALRSIERLKDINGRKGKKYIYYVSDTDGNPLDKDGNIINEESRLNENEIPGVNVEVDDDMITLSGDSGDYDGFIEDNGTVSFTVTNDEEEFNDQNWKDILGDDHAFVKIANSINTDVEALGDYVMITVKADDLTNMNESRLNEGKVKNQYVVKDEEESDEYGDFYSIDKKKAFEYLKQFNSKEVSAKQFIKDDEGWGEFEQYLEDVEQMSDKQLEDAMREEMSMYFFSDPDGI